MGAEGGRDRRRPARPWRPGRSAGRGGWSTWSGAAPAHDQVGPADQLGGQRRGEAAADLEVVRARREQARPTAEVVSSAPHASASAPGRPGLRRPGAPPGQEHRPLRARAATRASSAAASGAGRAGPQRRRRRDRRRVALRRLDVEREIEHHRATRRLRGPVGPDDVVHRRPGQCTRSGRRRPSAASASWSIAEVGPTAEPATSAASTSSGVRLFAASVMPVIALVRPSPGARSARRPGRWSGRTRRPSSRHRPRAGRRRTGHPGATSALVTWKLPLPTTPKTRGDAEVGERLPDHLGDLHRGQPAQARSTRASTRPGCPTRRRSAAAARSAARRWAAAARGSAAGSGRTCPPRAGRSGTGTAGRTSAPRPRRCRRSRPRTR